MAGLRSHSLDAELGCLHCFSTKLSPGRKALRMGEHSWDTQTEVKQVGWIQRPRLTHRLCLNSPLHSHHLQAPK